VGTSVGFKLSWHSRLREPTIKWVSPRGATASEIVPFGNEVLILRRHPEAGLDYVPLIRQALML
jgi:hypothetical protein